MNPGIIDEIFKKSRTGKGYQEVDGRTRFR